MVVFTITKVSPEMSEETPSRKLNFSNNASFRTEILPTLFKIQEFSCGSVVWIDSGMTIHRALVSSQVRPLMSPIRISNTGFNENISCNLEDILSSKELSVVNSKGERFSVKRSVVQDSTSLSSGGSSSKSTEDENTTDTRIKVTPVVMSVSAKTSKGELFAKVSDYVPRNVSSRL